LIRADVLNYMRKYPEQKNFNLFDVFISNASLAHQDAYFIPLKHVQFNIEYKREEFYNASSYRLLNDDTGWWGIIETECGIVGQYFLLISSDGEISQINTAFLPEQKMRWNAKKQKYKSTFDGQN